MEDKNISDPFGRSDRPIQDSRGTTGFGENPGQAAEIAGLPEIFDRNFRLSVTLTE